MNDRFLVVICFNCKKEMDKIEFKNCNDYYCKECRIRVTIWSLIAEIFNIKDVDDGIRLDHSQTTQKVTP